MVSLWPMRGSRAAVSDREREGKRLERRAAVGESPVPEARTAVAEP